MITVLTVSHDTLDFLKLLVQSVRKFRGRFDPEDHGDRQPVNGSKSRNGRQLNRMSGLSPDLRHRPSAWPRLRTSPRQDHVVLVLDSDAHVRRVDSDTDLIQLYRSDSRRRLIAARGGVEKPIHPCFMFFENEYLRSNQFLIPGP